MDYEDAILCLERGLNICLKPNPKFAVYGLCFFGQKVDNLKSEIKRMHTIKRRLRGHHVRKSLS